MLLAQLRATAERDRVPGELHASLLEFVALLPPERTQPALEGWLQQFPLEPVLQYAFGASQPLGGSEGFGSDPGLYALRRACELAGDRVNEDEQEAADAAEPEAPADQQDQAHREAASQVQRVRQLLTLGERCAMAENDLACAERCASRVLELDPGNAQADDLLTRVRRKRQRGAWTEDRQLFAQSSLRVHVSSDLLDWIDPVRTPDDDLFARQLPAMRERVLAITGVLPPGVRLAERPELPAGSFRVLIHGVPCRQFTVPHAFLAGAPSADIGRLPGPPEVIGPALRAWEAHEEDTWIDRSALEAVQAAGILVLGSAWVSGCRPGTRGV